MSTEDDDLDRIGLAALPPPVPDSVDPLAFVRGELERQDNEIEAVRLRIQQLEQKVASYARLADSINSLSRRVEARWGREQATCPKCHRFMNRADGGCGTCGYRPPRDAA